MKILYISNFYVLRNSSAAIRNNAFVKGLVELGHQVDVLTVRQSDTSISKNLSYGNIIYTDLFNLSLRKAIKGKVVGNGRLKDFLGNGYMKLQKILHFPDAYYKWPDKVDVNQLGNYDLLVTSSDGKISHFVGYKIKTARPHLKWVQIWGDPWLEDVNSTFYDKIRIRKYEKRFLEAADQVVYISRPTADAMKEKYPSLSNKISFVPRSYLNSFEYEVPHDGNFHITYTGALFAVHGRNIDNLVSIINEYNDHNDKKIFLDVYGVVDEEIKKGLKGGCVNYHDSIDVSMLPEVYKHSNALLYLSNKEGSTQIPGKLYDYIGTSSLVLCLVNNYEDGIAQFIKSIGDHCVLVKNTKEELCHKMSQILMKMEESYKPDVSFSPLSVAEEFVALVSKSE